MSSVKLCVCIVHMLSAQMSSVKLCVCIVHMLSAQRYPLPVQ